MYHRVSLASQIADLADNGKNVIATEISPSKHALLPHSTRKYSPLPANRKSHVEHVLDDTTQCLDKLNIKRTFMPDIAGEETCCGLACPESIHGWPLLSKDFDLWARARRLDR